MKFYFLIMNLHKAIIVPASVQLVIRQNFCIPHLPKLRCYNSTAPHWYQKLSEWYSLSYIWKTAKTTVILVACFSVTRAQTAPPRGYRQPTVSDSIICTLPGTYRRLEQEINFRLGFTEMSLNEPTLKAQFNGQNLCYLYIIVTGMRQMP
jgi:hypothetical protein